MEEAAQQPRKTMLLLLQLLLLPLAAPLLARECRGELDAAGVLEVPGALSRAECEAVASRQAELEQVEGIVLQTQTALDAERQKALLLVRSFNPALADALQREFEA